jgi:hypothetical protein
MAVRGILLVDADASTNGARTLTLIGGETRLRVSFKASGANTANTAVTGIIATGDPGTSLDSASAANARTAFLDVRGLKSVSIGWASLSGGTISIWYSLCGEDGL